MILGAQLLDPSLGRNAVIAGLLAETAGLLVASFLPARSPNPCMRHTISVLAAYQTANFKRVDRYAYNPTFITGNLRIALGGCIKPT